MDLMWPGFEPQAEVVAPSWDPLRHDEGTLELGELLDLRFDAGRASVGLMIDGGGSFVRVIVARKVVAMHWTVTSKDLRSFGRRQARYIETFACAPTPEGLLRFEVGLSREVDWDLNPVRDFDLSLTAAEFTSFALDVDGLPDAPPDYGQLDDAEVHRNRPDLTSDCRVIAWSHRTA